MLILVEEMSQVGDLSFYLKKKEEQTWSKRKEMMKIRAEINEIEKRKKQ